MSSWPLGEVDPEAGDTLGHDLRPGGTRESERYMKGAVCPGEIYTLAELEAMPTLVVGHTDDLKIDAPDMNLWLSRCGIEDGEPCNNKVTIEERKSSPGEDDEWIEVGWYEAL